MDPQQVLTGLTAAAIIILVSFPVHEFSHAFAAFKLGDSTARYQGRLTLNPITHFDPLGGILLVLSAVVGGFMIGWAKPTPVNPFNLRGGRRSEALVALAGPLSNLVLAAAVAIPLRLILMNDDMIATVLTNEAARFVFGVAEFFVVINVVLMIFNLLPIAPLDGWHVLLALVSPRTAYTLRQYEQYGFIVLILLIVSGVPFLGQLVDFVRGLLLGV